MATDTSDLLPARWTSYLEAMLRYDLRHNVDPEDRERLAQSFERDAERFGASCHEADREWARTYREYARRLRTGGVE